jgi:hypothetical protein
MEGPLLVSVDEDGPDTSDRIDQGGATRVANCDPSARCWQASTARSVHMTSARRRSSMRHRTLPHTWDRGAPAVPTRPSVEIPKEEQAEMLGALRRTRYGYRLPLHILLGLKSPGRAQRSLAAYGTIAQRCRPRRHLLSAAAYRQAMRQRFDSWQAITSLPTTT